MAKDIKIVIVKCDSNKENVKEFFDGLLEINGNIKINNIVYLLEGDNINKKYHLDEILNGLNYDLNANISVYESNVLANKEDLINGMINFYENNTVEGYSNPLILATNLLENKKNNELKELKNYLLYFLNDNSNYISIIKGMFKNNLNVSKTVNDVYMHRNTINNNLDVIEKKSGLNIQHFQDAYIMCYLMNM